MKSIAEMLKPRESVFSDTVREDTLNLSDFEQWKGRAEYFFSENYETQGMKILFETAFKRFKGESDTGVIKLTQAMGGGKTHSMLALALLASDEKLREKIIGKSANGIGEIKVVAFSGRENADYGIWGAIAEQLGKKDVFKDYYSPLKAPGEKAWIELLSKDKILILLDELPPYLDGARATPVGNSDLSKVTTRALANLFSALGKEQLANVCLVFSDLKATYESGSELIQSSFRDLEAEANRIAIEIAPVSLNTDEIYSILKKRLFEDDSVEENYQMEKNDIAIQFKDAVEKSKRMGFTSYTGEAVYQGIVDSYPFHPSIKDLYARFKENQNFQQTRGLIRLMRQIVREFFESGQAEKAYLINVYDVNLNNTNMMSQFRMINSSLEEAINHDIAQDGKSVAEIADTEAQDKTGSAVRMAKLLLVSSLSTAQGAIRGLTESEALGYLSAPGVDISIAKSAMETLHTQCWYLKADNRGRLYFQNTKNMVAEMNTLVDSYTDENAKKELREVLKETFRPKLGECYKLLYVLPAVDDIVLDQDKVSLVIFEPYAGMGLHPDLKEFYERNSKKNRVMFLSGNRSIMEKLYENSKKLKAIQQIIKNMDDEGTPERDQQRVEAETHLVSAMQALLSTIRETFVTLYFPFMNRIDSMDIKLEFKNNRFDGEEQVINALRDVEKYNPFKKDDQFLEAMRKKCEQRLFTAKEMTWAQILDRAANETSWPWYHFDQMTSLKNWCLKTEHWKEISGYLQKGPFEKEPTSVTVEQADYNPDTQEFTLSVRGIGGRVYYDVGSEPTSASAEVEGNILKTMEPYLQFVCIDPAGERKQGSVVEFLGKPYFRHGIREAADGRKFSFEDLKGYEIRYTTDGSEPKENGGVYTGEFSIPDGCRFISAVLMYKDQVIETKTVPISEKAGGDTEGQIDPEKPLHLRFGKEREFAETIESYTELETLAKIKGIHIIGANAFIFEKDNQSAYVELQTSIQYDPDTFKIMIDLLRENGFEEKDMSVTFRYKGLHFETGSKFLSWVELNKLDLSKLRKEGEIRQ